MATPEEQSANAQNESPTSRFTAVNGKEPVVVATPANGLASNGASRRGSDERSNGQPRISPPGQEKLTITTTTQREEWIQPSSSDRHTYLPPSGYSEAEMSHKRKRSGSMEPDSSSTNSYHSHAIPSSTKQTPTTATTEPETPRDQTLRAPSHSDQRDSYGTESQYRQFLANEDARESGVSHDHWHLRQYSANSQVTSDEQIGEVLQRASQHMDAQQHGDYQSPGDDDKSVNQYYDQDGSVQSDPKKRKRNFSNRTKTGCMTCRRRKKKCDENRPECNNCLRGGFVCSGYQQRGQWPKTEQKQPPIPLQSKTDYEASPFGQSQYVPQTHGQPQQQPRREPLPGYRGQSLRVDPQHGQGRRNMDDDQPSASAIPSASVTSPENNRLSAISYSHQIPTPITASSSAYPDRQPKSAYERVGPLHDMSRQESRQDSDTGTPQSASATLPQILHPQIHADSPHSNPQVAAQLALSNLASSSSRPRTQKEEMLAGRHYFPFDKELVLERERCNGACWRFNSSTNPNNGVSPEERARLFRDILQPREHVISPTQASSITPVGRVGDNVVVEAPFNCDYGYNISIGQDVAIGKNCTILDTCEVKIGDRCNIGPNVNIYTATLPVDPKRRLGSRGPNLGRKITIDSDCWIGGGVTILPGRTIGKGSTVGAGSIVTRDVPPYTVVCGNPARVIRGLYPPHDG
ncbi:uncharacterized protein L3040_001310 [Drepanopeziza brunnea f. sp. 'multigermtubi']|nr:hypothetical protein L3040_001310 [Drepanopeziza brunnea f. sp. 'multigermtubi']